MEYKLPAKLVEEILAVLDANSFVSLYGGDGEPEDEDNNDDVLAVSKKLREVISQQDVNGGQ
jgi:hypothetical protein